MAKVSLINTYQKYPAYKDSGVDWLGKLPSGWDISKNRRLFEIKKNIAGDLGHDVLSITQNGIKVKDIESNSGQLAADYSKYQLIDKGDFAMNQMDLLTGYVDISNYDGVISPDYRVFSKRNEIVFDRYFLYLFQLGYKQKLFYAHGRGAAQFGRWRMPAGEFNNFIFPLPTKEEQKKIAKFLDEQTARIDKTITKKQRLIELLKEKRTAIINHVVTKGLDPKAKLVDSGIEWLGEVNSSFEIIKLRYLVKVSTGSKDTANADPSGEYPFFVRSPKIEKINSYTFDGEAVLTAGDGAGVGKVFHYYKGKLDYHQRVYLFSNFKKVTGKYFYYYLSSNLARVVLMGESKSTVDSIRLPQLLKMPFTIPDIQDQDKIVCYLDKETKKFDELLGKVSFSIAKLQEFKSSLISHAVTGKIKV